MIVEGTSTLNTWGIISIIVSLVLFLAIVIFWACGLGGRREASSTYRAIGSFFLFAWIGTMIFCGPSTINFVSGNERYIYMDTQTQKEYSSGENEETSYELLKDYYHLDELAERGTYVDAYGNRYKDCHAKIVPVSDSQFRVDATCEGKKVPAPETQKGKS